MLVANIIIGLIFGAIGMALIVYAYPLNKKILFLSWVEKKYGQGTGPTAYKMLGLVLIFVGICAIIGWFDLATPILGGFDNGSKNTTNIGASNPSNIIPTKVRGDIAP
jgi:hypothetical protein